MSYNVSIEEIQRAKMNIETRQRISGLETLTKKEIYHSCLLQSDIQTIGEGSYSTSSTISLYTLLNECATSFNMLNTDDKTSFSSYVNQLFKLIKIQQLPHIENLMTETNATQTVFGWVRIPETIFIPNKISRETIIHMIHEMTHILKEFNPQELLGMNVTQDALPLFMELVNALENERFEVRYNVINKLQTDFYKMIQRSNELQRMLEKTTDQHMIMLIKEMININHQYYNSLFYALAILDTYLEDPIKVITFTNLVLTSQMTTKEMLKNLFATEKEEERHYVDGISEYNSLILKS